MKKFSCIVFTFIISFHIMGQSPVGSWTDHLRYNAANSIAVSSDEIYASTGQSLLVFNRQFRELKKMSTIGGLTETGISSIAWAEENSTLVVAYKSTNIDLVKGLNVYNLPDILNKYIAGERRINRVRTSGKYAYLAASFGIVVIDVARKEIYDTWKPSPGPDNNEVFDVAFGNNRVYAATMSGTWEANLSDQGLAYFGNWKQVSGIPDPGSKCNNVIFSGESLYINVPDPVSGDRIYSINGSPRLFLYIPGIEYISFDSGPEGFSVSSPGFIKYFRPDGTDIFTISSYGWGIPNIWQGIITGTDIWIGDLNYGLIEGKNLSEFSALSINGPSTDKVVNIVSQNGRTIICSGGTDNSFNSLNRSFQVSVYDNYLFSNIISATFSDAMRSVIDPLNSSHFYVSSWGDGLFEYDNGILVKHYNSSNSPLREGNTPGSGIKIAGLAFDRAKNLWIAQTDVSENIKILKSDGSWITYPVSLEAPVAGDIISASNNQKWIILSGGHGLFIIDDNGTPGIFSDDRFRKLTVVDNDDKIIPNVFAAAEDLDGRIWIGTDQGPVIYYNPDRIFEDNVKGYRIKVPRSDGSGLADYMLGTESITSIAVDGANRKWLATKNSGAYLLSADGTVMLKNYNSLNSPMFSDSIASVSIDNQTGEVWFGTSKGVLSARELATSGSNEFRNVYSFPNPVRKDFEGNVTITGLMKDTQVKITDVSGNLVYETFSEGGQAEWDLRTYNGKRVKSGVYLVFCSNPDGSKAIATKILVIGQ